MNTLTLDTVIREYLLQEGKDSLHDYKRYEQLAIGVLRDLHYNTDGVNKVTVLDVNSNGVAVLPEDFVKESRVAIVGGDGNLYDLSPNRDISLTSNIDTDCPVDYSQGTAFGLVNYGTAHAADGQLTGRWYGLGGKNRIGEYRIDRTHNVITFSQGVNYSTVTLEYIGNFQLQGGEIIIDPRSIDAIKAGIYSKKIAVKSYVSRGEKDAARRDYEVAKLNYNIMLRMPTPNEILNQSRKTFKAAPRL